MNEENKIINLSFDINSVNIILTGISKLPIEMGLNVFNSIHKQVNDQLNQETSGPLKDKIIK